MKKNMDKMLSFSGVWFASREGENCTPTCIGNLSRGAAFRPEFTPLGGEEKS